MVLDTSSILAILQNEPERRKFNETIEAAETRSLSTASFVALCSSAADLCRLGRSALRSTSIHNPSQFKHRSVAF